MTIATRVVRHPRMPAAHTGEVRSRAASSIGWQGPARGGDWKDTPKEGNAMTAAIETAPAAKPAATKKGPALKPAEKSSLDYLQHALDDLARAREQAQQEARAGIDSAVQRILDVRKDLTTRAHGEADELQTRLEHASEEALREFGRAAIRAQRTPDGLAQMQAEIRDRKRKLTV